jgi:hypothetical protein
MNDRPEEPDRRGDTQQEVDSYVREVQPPSKDILELEFVFEALANSRRRYLLYSLLSNTNLAVQNLATKLVAWERNIPEERVTDPEREAMYASLYHTHIPKLVDLAIVEFEADEETIVADRNAVQVLAALEGLGASIDAAQETHARGDHREA